MALLLTTLTGCWSNRPVEFRAMVLTIGIAPGHHGQIKIEFEIPSRAGLTSLTSGSTGGSKAPATYVVEAEGATPGAALTRAQAQEQTDLYLGETQIVAFSSHLSDAQFALAQDWLTRLGPLDKTAFAVTTPSVTKLLSATPSSGEMGPIDLQTGFSCYNCETVSFNQHQWDVEMAYPTPGDSIWMPWVTTTPQGFSVDRIVAYTGDRPSLVLTPRESMLLGYVLGRTGKGYLSFRIGSNLLGVRTVTAKPSVHTRLKHGLLDISVRLVMHGTVDDWSAPPLTPKLLATLEHETSRQMAQRTLHVLQKLQSKGSDPMAFGASIIWRQKPAWRSARVWESEYRKAHIHVHIDMTFTNVGDSN